jgi:hypothetical protein
MVEVWLGVTLAQPLSIYSLPFPIFLEASLNDIFFHTVFPALFLVSTQWES